jgi:hypothetical protein
MEGVAAAVFACLRGLGIGYSVNMRHGNAGRKTRLHVYGIWVLLAIQCQ